MHEWLSSILNDTIDKQITSFSGRSGHQETLCVYTGKSSVKHVSHGEGTWPTLSGKIYRDCHSSANVLGTFLF